MGASVPLVLFERCGTSGTLAPARSESRVHGRRLARNQLPQHKLQNPAIGVVLRLLRSVDAHQRVELFLACADFHLPACGKLPHQIADARNLKDFFEEKEKKQPRSRSGCGACGARDRTRTCTTLRVTRT